MIEKIIPTVIGALLTFFLGLISKQLADAKAARARHEAAYAESIGKLNDTADKLESLKRTVAESQMRTSRYRIIRFDDEELAGIRHSDDHWDQILEDVDIYDAFVHDPDNSWFKNHKGQAAMNRITLANQNGRGRSNLYV